MEDNGKAVKILPQGQLGNNNFDRLNGVRGCVLDQVSQQTHFTGTEIMRDKLADDVEICSLFKQPGCCPQVFTCRAYMEEGAGIFIKTECHKRSFIRTQGYIFFLEKPDKNRGC